MRLEIWSCYTRRNPRLGGELRVMDICEVEKRHGDLPSLEVVRGDSPLIHRMCLLEIQGLLRFHKVLLPLSWADSFRGCSFNFSKRFSSYEYCGRVRLDKLIPCRNQYHKYCKLTIVNGNLTIIQRVYTNKGCSWIDRMLNPLTCIHRYEKKLIVFSIKLSMHDSYQICSNVDSFHFV